MRTWLTGFRLVDADRDEPGALLVEDGRIAALLPDGLGTDGGDGPPGGPGDAVIDGRTAGGRRLALLPAFVELHAHFRDPGYPAKETLESGCLAAVAGGYATVVCMANTNPPMDDPAAAAALKARSDALGLIDLYPALSLTRGMAGTDCAHLDGLAGAAGAAAGGAVRLLSEDGKDVADAAVFAAALAKAAALDLPVSCHCDAGGMAADAAKAAGVPREIWSRIEENVATERALRLARDSAAGGAGGPGRAGGGLRLHLAHVSTAEAVALLRAAKAEPAALRLTAEAAPHHLALTQADAAALGGESSGRVNPPLREEADRQALLEAVADGTIDAIATDHAPHTAADKAAGAPGFTGLETAFAVCYGELVRSGRIGLGRLSALMSARPAAILGLADRGRLAAGQRADLVLVDLDAGWTVEPDRLRSRGKNTPFAGRRLAGRILAVLRGGRLVYDARS